MYTYPGNIHIHSSYSDGSATIAEIIDAAQAAGLRYMIINDHETLAAMQDEGYYGRLLVLAGIEINRAANHYLAFNLTQSIANNDHDPQQLIDEVSRAGGFGFIAHPFDRGSRYIEKGKAYPWTAWPVFGFTGFEIWNFSSHWRGLHPSLPRTLYWFFFNRNGAMHSPYRRLLKLWDCYNIHGHKTAAIGGSDAHAYLYRLGPFRIPIFTYRYSFKTINTYICLQAPLSDQFQKAKSQALTALAAGNCYVSFDALCSGQNFYYNAISEGKIYLQGDSVELSADLTLRVVSPARRSQIRLIYNHQPLISVKGQSLCYQPEVPGVYRVEVYHRSFLGRYRPWIYSNPIHVTAPDKS